MVIGEYDAGEESTEKIIDEWCSKSYWNGWIVGCACGAVALFTAVIAVIYLV